MPTARLIMVVELVKVTMEIFIQQCKRDRLVLFLAMLLPLFADAILA